MEITEFYTAPIHQPLRRVSDYMKEMEDAGLAHMALCGHRLEDMWTRGESMMFSRAGIRLIRPDLQPDTVRTRIIFCKGVRAQRAFQFYAGDILTAEGLNESFCVRMDTHQVIRADWFSPINLMEAEGFELHRLPAAKEQGEAVATCTVDPQDVDYNGHLHNTRYWDYAQMALGDDALPQEMHLQFHREILPGAPFTLYRMPDGCTVVGRQHGEVAFTACRHA